MASIPADDQYPRPVVRFPRAFPSAPVWLEGRIWAEYASLVRDPVFYGRGVPRGGGRPVLLIPGFLAGDSSLNVMSGWLRRLGYRPTVSGISFNVHYSERTLEGVVERLRRTQLQHGRKLIVIGHSRGGLLGKVLADRHPDLVEQVIALGSPLADVYDIHPLTAAGVQLARLYNWVRYRLSWDAEADFLRELAEPPRTPITSIYTRSDGIVNWRACLRADIAAVEVTGTHSGLGVNPEVYRTIGRLLRRD